MTTQATAAGPRNALTALIARGTRRLRTYGLRAHLLGLLLRARLPGRGPLVVMGGWHLPEVDDRGGRIVVGSCGVWPGVRLECWRDATIRIGDGTYLNRGVEVVAATCVEIGRDCAIGRDVIIMDSDQHALPGEAFAPSPVTIGDRVWVGARTIVLKGVSIGHDSIIGAGSIVTRDIPPSCIAVGQPARVLRTISAR
jgi:acetyltransferase-like isoleucine patch superfamily enzyme